MLVWSQLAVAAYACPKDGSFTASPAAAMADMSTDCARDMRTQPAPLCKAHCDPSVQSNQTPSFELPPVVLVAQAPVLDVVDLPHMHAIFARPVWLVDASPPLRIQYQVFRN